MDRKKFIDILFNKGKDAGFEEMEVYISGNKELEIMAFKGEVDNYTIAEKEGLSFRGIYNGKMGYSYTEKIDESSIDLLINEAIENSKIVDLKKKEYIFEGSNEYEDIVTYNKQSEKISTEEKIDFAINLENEGRQIDNRVDNINYCLFNDSSSSTMIANTKGLNLESKSNMYVSYVSALVKEGDDVKTGDKFIVSNDFSDFNYKEMASEAVSEGLSMLGAKSIESGDYPVILRSDVSANILKAFAEIFSADNVQKDLSLLKDKIGEKIATSSVSIIDDPFMKNGAYTSSFDAEGVATTYKKIVDKGVLTTYLYNLKTAKKDNTESTGNAFKASYKSPIEIAPTNMYIENGDISFDEMVSGIDRGVIIIDVQGLHSGLNTISGDFSLSAYGYEILNGKINRPINQITVSGNYYDVLKNVEQIGNDLTFALPGKGYIGSPSIKVKTLSIAGE
ncbi:MAG: TldD/PmbA family protein [Vallitalea sp.]|jgi:PmbA protein|nr:TldD/PmbA family protein [Vallitalea sp.]